MTTKVPPLYINYNMVRKAGACEGQRRLFKETFGTEDVFLTKENVMKAVGVGLSMPWLWGRFTDKAALKGVPWQAICNIENDLSWMRCSEPEEEAKIYYKRFIRLAKLMHKRGAFNAT